MLYNIYGYVLCIIIGIVGLFTVLRIFKTEKEFEKRYKELLEKEKLLHDLQSQICKTTIKKCDSCHQDL